MPSLRARIPEEGEALAEAFSSAAKRFAGREADFRASAEKALAEACERLGVELDERREVTLATGRADAVFNRLIVEWEPPGAMAASRDSHGNRHAVEQVQSYIDGLAAKERRQVTRLAGVACDGHSMIFARYRSGRWWVDDPVAVDAKSAGLLLDTLLSAQSGKALIAENLLGDFAGEGALAYKAVRSLLAQLDRERGQRPDDLPARLFDQWESAFAVATGVTGEAESPLKKDARKALADVLGTVPGETDAATGLFVIQTYFAIVTKLIAALSLSLFLERSSWHLDELKGLGDGELNARLAELHRGLPFREARLNNVIEPDVFCWFLERTSAEVTASVRAVVDRLATYDPATLQVSPEDARDLLKDLYQGLLPRPVRHALGQYFTPDWLAERVLGAVEHQGGPDERVLDPACGTGTFLVSAVRELRASLLAENASGSDSLACVLDNVVGFDIDPLAVVASRVNYVLALGQLLAEAPPEGCEIPVYLADSILSPTLLSMHTGDRLELSTSVGTFRLPLCVDTAEELRAVCDLATLALEEGWDSERFGAEAGRACRADDDERRLLEDFFDACWQLHSRSIDGIWTRIIRNAFMPAFIGEFDLIVGNPPWVNWEGLPEDYRERTKALWEEAGLYVHKGMAALLGAGKKDVSMLLSYVVSKRLLGEHGRLGFVMPETLFKTAGAGQGFRRFRFGDDGPSFRVTAVHDMVDLKPFTGATNRTAILVWERDAATRYPVGYTVWQRLEARGIDRHASPEEVEEQTRRLRLVAAPVRDDDSTSAWLTVPRRAIPGLRKLAETGEPAYRAYEGVNTGGANGVYWVERSDDVSKGKVPIENLHDVGRSSLPRKFGRVEADLLHPLLRGQDVQRWSAKPSCEILFVQDPATRRGIDTRRMQTEFPGALSYLAQFEDHLRSRAAIRRYFTRKEGIETRETGPYWSMFNVGDYTLAEHKVVWKDIASDFAAAVLPPTDPIPLPAHTVMLLPCSSSDEAHYVCGLLNSVPARALIAGYVATHISTHTTKVVVVPSFEASDSRHFAVSSASREAHRRVDAGESADQGAVDDAAAAVWGLDAGELATMRDFLRRWLKQDLS
ncbi:MAG: SAM-dependent DNA methyltransferase [Acidobacteria bacterium]|nr:MAG: SAM-dependent DNA methyltransferase [Acidobacteriota bacterium]